MTNISQDEVVAAFGALLSRGDDVFKDLAVTSEKLFAEPHAHLSQNNAQETGERRE